MEAAVSSAVGTVAATAAATKANVVATRDGGKGAVVRKVSAARAEMVNWAKRRTFHVFERLVDKIPEMLKASVEDENMPASIKDHIVDKAVDEVWPSLREEILYEAMVRIDGSPQKQEEHFDHQPGSSRLRAYLRYSLLPYNKRRFGVMKSPVWIVFQLFTITPIAGIAPIMYTLLFLVIDKRDRYQLVLFICAFKQMSFFTQGLLRNLYGFFLYFACVTSVALTPRELVVGASQNTLLAMGFPFETAGHPSLERDEAKEHRCMDFGPGRAVIYPLAVSGVFLEVAICWTAFLLVPFAKEKGRTDLQSAFIGDEHREEDDAVDKFRYMRALLFYDLCMFLFCATLFTVVCVGNSWTFGDWPARQLFFGCQILYGFSSFPFFLFGLPGVNMLLSRAKPTLYDERGVTRRPDLPRGDRRRHRHNGAPPEDEEDEAWMSNEDFNGIVERMRGLLEDSAGTCSSLLPGLGLDRVLPLAHVDREPNGHHEELAMEDEDTPHGCGCFGQASRHQAKE